MEQESFEDLLGMAKSLHELHTKNQEYGKADWWRGFKRGLRRLYHGENFGTDEEHNKWMNCADGEYRKQLQAGYRTGFKYHGQRLSRRSGS